jgi:hypothetical protein
LHRSLNEPVMTNPLADPVKPVERAELEEKPAETATLPSPALAEPVGETVEVKPAAVPVSEKPTP